ncbi:hypothetical protein QUB08_29200 [Microcoleus sp. BR0-C5]|uniref:hypothetical protein n=1 Tax=Microcoleus sp. BR0-C5 TaxID=2818713 RepID=UPI002FD08234
MTLKTTTRDSTPLPLLEYPKQPASRYHWLTIDPIKSMLAVIIVRPTASKSAIALHLGLPHS